MTEKIKTIAIALTFLALTYFAVFDLPHLIGAWVMYMQEDDTTP